MHALLPVANVLGRLLMFFSLTYLAPIACSLLYHDGTAVQFVDAMLITAGTGLVLTFGTKRYYRELKIRDGFLLVTLSWTLMAAIGAVPLLLVYSEISYTDAFFETLSALTTTGATVLSNLDNAPPAINFWRHELQWLGGMGIIVLAVAIMPLLGVGGMQLYRAEMAGPLKESRFTARIADTAKALWLVYLGLTGVCIIALRLAGMSWFDAICHGFATVSLGGFSTRDASIAAFDSPAIEAVLMAFMVISAINFATHFLAWRTRSLRCYFADTQARVFLVLIAGACFLVTAYLYSHGVYPDLSDAIRQAMFNAISIATSCGFSSADWGAWPIFAPLFLMFLANIAPCSGSTGGGIKMVRTLILYKQARRELHKLLHPNIADLIKLGDVAVPNKVAFSVLGFIFLYFMTVVVMTLLLLLSGLSFLASFSAVISCITNLGPALDIVGPIHNYAGLSAFQKWVLSATMLLGRLEILSVAVIFTRYFWRK